MLMGYPVPSLNYPVQCPFPEAHRKIVIYQHSINIRILSGVRQRNGTFPSV